MCIISNNIYQSMTQQPFNSDIFHKIQDTLYDTNSKIDIIITWSILSVFFPIKLYVI